LSFTAFLAACVGHAVDMNKSVHAYRNWRNQLVLEELEWSALKGRTILQYAWVVR
jgi:hypothetical protein